MSGPFSIAAMSPNQFYYVEAMFGRPCGDGLDPLGVQFAGGYQAFDASPEQQAAKEAARLAGRDFFPKWSTPLLQTTADPASQALFKERFSNRVLLSNQDMITLFRNAMDEAVKINAISYGSCGYVIKGVAIKLGSDESNSVVASIESVYTKTLRTPTTASDLVYVIHGITSTGESKDLFVGMNRLRDPGKGKLAVFGGFRDIERNPETDTDHYETGVQGALREGKEEAGITLTFPGANLEDYDLDNLKGVARLRTLEKSYSCRLNYAGTIKTSDAPIQEGGERFPDGTKRVHTTSAHLAVIDVGADFDDIAAHIDTVFKAGSDADKIAVWDMNREEDPSFGILHHSEIYRRAKEMVLSDRERTPTFDPSQPSEFQPAAVYGQRPTQSVTKVTQV